MREWLMRVLRVPARPDLPAGGSEPVKVFRAASSWLTYQRIRWGLKQAGALAGLVAGLYWLNVVNWMPSSLDVGVFTLGPAVMSAIEFLIEAVAWTGFAFQAVVSLMLMRLDWDQRWYLVSDRSLRVREGLVRLHEKTTTFENIQNVTIRQGPLQRALGIADLEVRSAGGGGSKEDDGSLREDLHTVWFRGVADAADIRDTILRRVQRVRASPRDAVEPASVEDAVTRLAAAADALRLEARALGASPAILSLPRSRSDSLP